MELFDVISEKETVNKDKISGRIETSGFCCDTRVLRAGDTFFAIPGAKSDGGEFAAEAVKKGACAVVAEKPFEREFSVPVVLVKDVRKAFAKACFFTAGQPQKKLKIIGVTGTNGKTTIASAVKKILSDAGKKCALFTTVGYDVCGAFYPSSHTTPPPEKLAPLFAQAVENGAEYAVMEVSSHSIAQKRIAAIDFEVGIFTNITRDHLDYHKTMEEYAAVKASFFEQCEHSIINADDEKAQQMAQKAKSKVYFVSEKDAEASFFIKDTKLSVSGITYTLSCKNSNIDISVPITGDFNIYNTSQAAATALILGIDKDTIARSLRGFGGAPGRMETVCREKLPFSVIIDYAHTPDALEKALYACKKITSSKLWCVFGCGGNRDHGKRPEMGKAAASIADIAVITSDNPRTEEPDAIISDIVKGVPEGKNNYITITDRKKAIEYTLAHAEAGDTILLAGKGHETYIDDKNGKHYFSEKDVVINFTERNGF